ncbi:NlpC/P60 family protein [Oscillospiraceae bacterium]|nr:NlpC/P60 family protein [Oscillospiraceae bacterium]
MRVIRVDDSLLTRLIDNCIDPLDTISGITHRRCAVTDGRCIAAKMCEVSEYFIASVLRCIDAMRNDWSYVGVCLGCFRELDSTNASLIRQNGIPTTGNFEEWRQISFDSRTVRGPLGMRVPAIDVTVHRIDLSYDRLYVTALDLEAVRNVIGSLRSLGQAADEYVERSNIFIASPALLGRYGNAIKTYIRITHLRIMRRIADLAYEMARSFSSYVGEYDSMYGGNDFLIDEQGLETLIDTLRIHNRNIAQEVYEADRCIDRLNEKNIPVVRLEDNVSSATTQYVRSIIGEVNDLTYIEGRGRRDLQQYMDDLDILYQYADLFGRNCGRGLMTSNTTRLSGLSSRIMTRRNYDVTNFFARAGITDDGTISDYNLSEFRRELESVPDLASRMGSSLITDDSMRGMIRYYAALLQIGIDQTEATNTALNRMFDCPEWLDKIDGSLSSGNEYLSDPNNLISSVEHRPEDVIRDAIDWGIRIAKDDKNHGYYKDTKERRWGPDDYDCASFAVCMFTDGAGLQIPHGPDDDKNIVVSNMYDRMHDYGFEKVDFDNDCSKLQPGDILVINPSGETAHAEVYIGDGRTIHATSFDDAADPAVGDQQRRKLEDNIAVNAANEGKEGATHLYDLNDWGEYFDDTFGTNIRETNYADQDGLPYVGEITGYRIAKPGSNEYIDAGNRGEVAYVIRYTGGI